MQDTFLRLCASTALAGALALPATAQQIINLEEITFSANLVPTELARSGSSVSVITRDEIDRSGLTNINDLLTRFGGVSMTQNGPTGTTSDIRIRGVEPRFVSVFVDGVQINNPGSSTGSVDFGMLQLADVSRIEVLRGAQSALFGGSAVAGVINITTERAEADGVSQALTVIGGSFGTLQGSYTLRQRMGPLSYALTASHSRARGFSAADGEPEPDGHRKTRLSFVADYQFDNNWTLGASVFVERSNFEYDDWLVDAPHEQDSRVLGGRIFARYSTAQSSQTLEYTRFQQTNEQRDNLPGTFRGSRDRIAWIGQTDLSPMHSLTYGADFARELARGRTVPQGESSTNKGVFVQSIWAATDSIDIVTSSRVERNSNYGTLPTYRLAVSYRPADMLNLRASVGTGFRAPSVEQRFGATTGPFPFVGNPNLKAERSVSYEIGADLSLDAGTTFSATVFQIDVKDLIQSTFCPFDPDTSSCVAGTTNSVVNGVGQARSRGLEFAGTTALTDVLFLSGNYTYTDARQANGERRSRVPRHDFNIGLDATLSDRLQARLSLQYVADRLDFLPNFTTGPMPNYAVTNLSMRYALTNSADLTLRVDNVFNLQYQHVAGYGTSDRAFYLGVASRF
ncbi:MAG: TonB-dependent receptor [Roseinatronobacter sp.]|nr:TonB-dependent receptor [Roseinatronobacter sp.]